MLRNGPDVGVHVRFMETAPRSLKTSVRAQDVAIHFEEVSWCSRVAMRLFIGNDMVVMPGRLKSCMPETVVCGR